MFLQSPKILILLMILIDIFAFKYKSYSAALSRTKSSPANLWLLKSNLKYNSDINTTNTDEIVAFNDWNKTKRPSSRSLKPKFDDGITGRVTSVVLTGDYSPMERIVLTANGNLQRLLSAYYGAPITVRVKKSEKHLRQYFDREVELFLGDKVICSVIGQAVESGEIGIGQLFRSLQTQPIFHLHDAGRHPSRPAEFVEGLTNNRDSIWDPILCQPEITQRFQDMVKYSRDALRSVKYELWRDYELYSPELHCRFLEVYSPGFLELKI